MPLERQGNPIIFYAFYTDAGAGATALAVTVDVWEVQTDGTAAEIVAAANATEIGDGLYRYRLVGASVNDDGEYIAVFKTAGTVDQAHIPAIWTIGHTTKAVADETLSRGVANVEDSADGTSLAEQLLAAFESVLAGGTWTIYKTDHSTPFSTRTVTRDANAQPIVEVT
jgi:hypothetical protein